MIVSPVDNIGNSQVTLREKPAVGEDRYFRLLGSMRLVVGRESLVFWMGYNDMTVFGGRGPRMVIRLLNSEESSSCVMSSRMMRNAE